MNELGKVTAFVVTRQKLHHLLVFKHPTAGIQLPAGTVEPEEAPVEAAKREVREETGIEVTSRGVVLGEQVSQLGPVGAVLHETIDCHAGIFRRGHQVSVMARDEARGVVQICEEIYDFGATPPKLLSCTEGEVPADALAYRIRRTFVLFVERARPTEPWIQRADGHDFEVRWTRLHRDVPLFAGQKEWLVSNLSSLRASLSTAHKD